MQPQEIIGGGCRPRQRVQSAMQLAALLAALVIGAAARAPADDTPPLRLTQTIPLPNVQGRLDHLAVDLRTQRLFVAARGNNTVEVVDLRAGRWIQSLTGFREPQGVAFVENLGKLFVTNGGTGAVNVLAGESFAPITSVKFPGDADNVRYDDSAARLYVGYGNGALGIIDARDVKLLGQVTLAAHPESFQLETRGTRLFVNVPDARQITVLERPTQRVVATWALPGARANFPMALDETAHRLFVGCRQPAELIIFDTEAGTPVGSLESVGDSDDIFYDREHKRIYVVGGGGHLDVVTQQDADHYVLSSRLPTAPGARTALFVPEMNRLYIAVPRHAGQPAEVRGYDVQS